MRSDWPVDAIQHEPAVLLLDEPDTGLDQAGKQVLAEIIASQTARDGAVIFTTHSFEFGLQLATRAVSLQDGSVSLDRPVDAIRITELDQYVSAPVQRVRE